MQYGEFNTNQAIGVRLCRNVSLDEKYYVKGHALTAEDIDILKKYNINKVFGVVFEEGDIDYRTALTQVAAKICGEGLGYFVDDDGLCKVVAIFDGIYIADENRLDKFNGFNEHFILNTISPYTVVKSGDIIAELEVTPTLLHEDEINDMLFRLSGNVCLMKIGTIKERQVSLVYTNLIRDESENMDFTSVVMKLVTNFEGMGLKFAHEINSQYEKNILAESLFDACKSGADVVFVISPLCSSGSNNVLAASLKIVSDKIFNYFYPQVGASDLLIGKKGNTTIIVLPHSYGRVDTVAIDSLIKHALFTSQLTEADFTHKRPAWLAYGSKLAANKQNKLIRSTAKSSDAAKASVGIVILAAGQGRRAGANKLMIEDKNGEPLFMHAVKAAVASDARPVFVITGYRHEEMEEWLDKYDINVLYNPSYTSGIKTSISLGLRSIPSSCDGAILLPADMPNIKAADLNKLINVFDTKGDKQICMMSNYGIKSNPVLWSKSLYDYADIVPENSQVRTIFVEHSDYIKTVEIKDKKKFFDVNYPSDVKKFAQE